MLYQEPQFEHSSCLAKPYRHVAILRNSPGRSVSVFILSSLFQFSLYWSSVAFAEPQGSVAAVSLQADASHFVPAMLRTDRFSLANAIEFPRGKQDVSVSLPCTTTVNKQGELAYTFCLAGKDDTRLYERNIILGSRHAKMTPARVAGRAEIVVFKFTTIFERRSGSESIYVVPHHFLNVASLGVHYVAPQLIRDRLRHYPLTCRGINLILRLHVDRNGRPSSATYHRGEQGSKGCVAQAKQLVPKLRYLPGLLDGQPMGMDHLYLTGWRGSWAGQGDF